MGLFSRNRAGEDEETSAVRTQYEQLTRKFAKVEVQLAALREERDSTREVSNLKREITKLTIDRDRIKEDGDRQVREAEHQAGLLLTGQEQETANVRRETMLEVREGNLAAERKRFEENMKFRDDQVRGEMSRLQEMTQSLLDLVPKISVELEGGVSAAPSRSRTPASRKPAED